MNNGYLYVQSATANWADAGPEIYLGWAENHIWRISASALAPKLQSLKRLLNAAETEKIFRYKSAANRQTRIISRAVLKILLGRYLQVDPQEISFKPEAQKKPIVKTADQKPIHFNVSHSGNWILIAISKKSIGVDLEQIDASFTYQNLLDYSFSLDEKKYIQTSKFPDKNFYQLWTRKEALLKATGQGLVDDLALIPSLDGNHPSPDQLINSAESWQITSFNVDGNHIASTAFIPVKTVLQFFNFQL